ncbi:MAG: choice-of-anchor Q domain-containing protein, partial [Candidatus Binataceae bacterium]
TITLGSQLPNVVNTLTVNGSASNPATITIDGAGKYELLVVNAGATLNLQSLTFTHAGGNAALQNLGKTSVTNCTFANNNGTASTVLNQNTLSVTNSTFSDNSASGSGGTAGGGAIVSAGALSVTNSTFSGNSGLAVGGIFSVIGTLSVTNSTFSGNSASGGSGVGAIFALGGILHLKGTILAASTSGRNCVIPGVLINDGYNISDDASCFLGSSTGANGQTLGDNVNPLLDPNGLANNGGPTETIALQPTSPAVDAIPFADCTDLSSPPNQLTTDQRGEPRPDPEDGANGACDIGAYELQASTPFARFRPILIVNPPGYFLTQGTFTLATGRPPLDPATETVTVTLSSKSLAPVALTIPADSFKKFFGQYAFRGKVVGGVSVSALITGFRNNYVFLIEADGLNLTGIGNPVTVTLRIDSDTGTKNVRAFILGHPVSAASARFAHRSR